jgi:predicted metal-dependent phosphoesterase TrpH
MPDGEEPSKLKSRAQPVVMRIDCHVHTEKSGDSRTPILKVLEAAAASEIDVVCITDHGRIDGAVEARALAASLGLPVAVVVGQECRTWAGEIIGLFLTERIPGNSKPEEVVERVRSQGGLVYIPHPFCPRHARLARPVLDSLVASGQVDLLEVHNAKAEADANEEARIYAAEAGLVGAAGSDAHYPEFVGAAFVSAEVGSGIGPAEIADDPQLFLEALRGGSIHRGTYSYSQARWIRRVEPDV